ncbi:hypothetical protein GCM10022243_19040 [Saccharothrix violaceirubra]
MESTEALRSDRSPQAPRSPGRGRFPDAQAPTTRTVLFVMNCGTVRYAEGTKVLDESTERYRAQGGDIPAPPWKW